MTIQLDPEVGAVLAALAASASRLRRQFRVFDGETVHDDIEQAGRLNGPVVAEVEAPEESDE